MTPERVLYFAEKMKNHEKYQKTVDDMKAQEFYKNQIIILGGFWYQFVNTLKVEEFDEVVTDKKAILPMPESVEKQIEAQAFSQFDLGLLTDKWDIKDAPSNYASQSFIDEKDYKLEMFTRAFDIVLDKYLEHGTIYDIIDELRSENFKDDDITELGIGEDYIKEADEINELCDEVDTSLELPEEDELIR